MSSQIGINTVGQSYPPGYSVLVNKADFAYRPVGVTIDWTTVTAEAAVRTLDSGYTTHVGEKIIPAGSILYKITTGSTTSKWGVAASGTTLVRGEVVINEHDISDVNDGGQIGTVFEVGNVYLARLKYGSSLPSLANVRTAFPAIRFF